jgi:hypothetical protein
MTKPICLWSGPRNVSTALMYSFAQREDTTVVDEPLYGHYLRVSGAKHPGAAEVMAAMNCDGDAVMRELLDRQARDANRRFFLKHMAHHVVGMDSGFLDRTSNIFLIRDPREMLPSLTIQIPHARLADTGLKRQSELFDALVAAGHQPAILDSRELLLDPPGVLRQLCEQLGMPFASAMLEWEPGPRPEDGVWAPHWYHAVHESSGFAPYQPKKDFPVGLAPLLDECQPWYERLFEKAIRAGAQGDKK